MSQPSSEVAPGVWLEEFTDNRFVMTEKNGRASVFIHRSKLPTLKETPPYQVRESGNVGQEIVNEDGNIVCWTTDPVVAALIAKLLTLHRKVAEKKSLPSS